MSDDEFEEPTFTPNARNNRPLQKRKITSPPNSRASKRSRDSVPVSGHKESSVTEFSLGKNGSGDTVVKSSISRVLFKSVEIEDEQMSDKDVCAVSDDEMSTGDVNVEPEGSETAHNLDSDEQVDAHSVPTSCDASTQTTIRTVKAEPQSTSDDRFETSATEGGDARQMNVGEGKTPVVMKQGKQDSLSSFSYSEEIIASSDSGLEGYEHLSQSVIDSDNEADIISSIKTEPDWDLFNVPILTNGEWRDDMHSNVCSVIYDRSQSEITSSRPLLELDRLRWDGGVTEALSDSGSVTEALSPKSASHEESGSDEDVGNQEFGINESQGFALQDEFLYEQTQEFIVLDDTESEDLSDMDIVDDNSPDIGQPSEHDIMLVQTDEDLTSPVEYADEEMSPEPVQTDNDLTSPVEYADEVRSPEPVQTDNDLTSPVEYADEVRSPEPVQTDNDLTSPVEYADEVRSPEPVQTDEDLTSLVEDDDEVRSPEPIQVLPKPCSVVTQRKIAQPPKEGVHIERGTSEDKRLRHVEASDQQSDELVAKKNSSASRSSREFRTISEKEQASKTAGLHKTQKSDKIRPGAFNNFGKPSRQVDQEKTTEKTFSHDEGKKSKKALLVVPSNNQTTEKASHPRLHERSKSMDQQLQSTRVSESPFSRSFSCCSKIDQKFNEVVYKAAHKPPEKTTKLCAPQKKPLTFRERRAQMAAEKNSKAGPDTQRLGKSVDVDKTAKRVVRPSEAASSPVTKDRFSGIEAARQKMKERSAEKRNASSTKPTAKVANRSAVSRSDQLIDDFDKLPSSTATKKTSGRKIDKPCTVKDKPTDEGVNAVTKSAKTSKERVDSVSVKKLPTTSQPVGLLKASTAPTAPTVTAKHSSGPTLSTPSGAAESNQIKKSSVAVTASSETAKSSSGPPATHLASQPSMSAPKAAAVTKPVKERIDFLFFMHLVLDKWNAKWLHERELMKVSPPACHDPLYPLIGQYNSMDDYLRIMRPLLLYELWEQVYRDYKMSCAPNQCATATFRTRGVFSEDVRSDPTKQFLLLHCEGSAEFNKDVQGLSAYDLVTVEGVLKKDNTDFTCFGLMDSVISNKHDNLSTMKVKVRIRERQHSKLNLDKPIIVKGLTSVVSLKHQLDALLYLPNSSLVCDILKPIDRSVFNTPNRRKVAVKRYMNPSQREAIERSISAIRDPRPRICLIQGPPGTGKSRTIIELIANLFEECGNKEKNNLNAKLRILVCAPSNNAVDELMRRLISLRNTQEEHKKLKLIRVGQAKKIDPKCTPYSLDNLALKKVESSIEKGSLVSSIESEKMTLIKKINTLKSKLRYVKDPAAVEPHEISLKKLERDLKLLQDQVNRAREKRITAADRQKIEGRACLDLIAEADIICCTLNMSGCHEISGAVHNQGVRFSAIIVDEAAQTTEVDCLVPLQTACSKLILVGDPAQLQPTVLSKDAQEKRFGQSLFKRFYRHFEHSKNNPIMLLDVQYRMHPEIVMFPSKYTYGGRLKTDMSVLKRKPFQYKPIVLVNLTHSTEKSDRSGQIFNVPEANAIARICCAMKKKLQSVDGVGIITPNQVQCKMIKIALPQQLQQEIEVNTVDGFQGREKDVIILSCVRAQNESGGIGFLSNPQTLNVALTRAKYSLFIIGHFQSLKVDPMWRELYEDGRERNIVRNIGNDLEGLTHCLLARDHRH